MLICFLVFLQCADCRPGAKPHGNAQHHAKTDVIYDDSNEHAKAKPDERARKSRGFFKKALEGLSLLPEMLPSIVLVIGHMLFWNAVYKIIPLYNTIWIMVLAYVVLYLPYTVQYVTSALTQINDSLLQAGRVFGGTPSYVFRRVTLPMISRGIFAGWLMIFIIAFRELVTASLIAPPNTLVVSTYINREFEQESVSSGCAMAVLCVLVTTTALLVSNRLAGKRKGT